MKARRGTALLKFDGHGGGVTVEFDVVPSPDGRIFIDLTGQVFGLVHGQLTLEIALPDKEGK